MKRSILIFALGLLGAQIAHAAEICEAVKLEHPALSERTRVVKLPDGHIITLVGHVHGERNSLKRFGDWVKQPDDELSNSEWINRLNRLIVKNRETLLHAAQDLAFMRATLWEAQEPIFVPVESQEDDIGKHVQFAMQIRSGLAQSSRKREMDNLRLIRDVELITMGGPLYSFVYDRELKKKYKLVGMEGTEEGVRLQNAGRKKMQTAELRLARIRARQGLDESIVDQAMDDVVDEMNVKYDDIANILPYDRAMIRDRVAVGYPNLEKDVKGAVLLYLYGYLDYLRGMKKRDVFFARKLTRQQHSGLFFVGKAHLESLANLLELQCEQMKTGNPAIGLSPQTELEAMMLVQKGLPLTWRSGG